MCPCSSVAKNALWAGHACLPLRPSVQTRQLPLLKPTVVKEWAQFLEPTLEQLWVPLLATMKFKY
jgi:hypothetical protein